MQPKDSSPTPSHLTPRTDAYGETDMKSKPLTCSKEEWEHFASVLQGWAKLCRDLELELNAASKPTCALALDAGGAMIGQAPYTGCIGDVTKQAHSSEKAPTEEALRDQITGLESTLDEQCRLAAEYSIRLSYIASMPDEDNEWDAVTKYQMARAIARNPMTEDK